MADVTHSFVLPFLVAADISLAGMIFPIYLKKPVAVAE